MSASPPAFPRIDAAPVRVAVSAVRSWAVQSSPRHTGEDSASLGPTIHLVVSHTISCEGDALRELESRGVELSDPFILMTGDTVANVNMHRVVAEHNARRAKDPSVLMTMCVRACVRPCVCVCVCVCL